MAIISLHQRWQAHLRPLIELLKAARLDVSDEKRTQRDMAEVFDGRGIEYQREVRLSKADIVDFMVHGIALEVKLKGANKRDVFRQLERYAEHESVNALVLASNITMGLPTEINGKPIYFIHLGRGWL